ncbi:MAG: ABC transporter ATP-binding protein, partial [Verrucomicrobia bacterium]|nr:ABC transporter ATP-binding protein [Verrucomicrobiota bacterium]
MNLRFKKFLSYYKPYLGLFYADMACAIVVSGTLLAIPLCIRYITKNPDSLSEIYIVGAIMLTLVAIHALCHSFIDYKGHMMGALMERDMRNELFAHYQKLSFKFYDDHRTGELLTRISNDTFDLAELYHHGPEDIVIALLNFTGAFIILLNINVQLALIAFLFLPIMGLYGFYFSRKMHHALRRSRDRIGTINAQVEDTLAGIRVVQSFTNEALENKKFHDENRGFVDSRRDGYKNEAYFYNGLLTLTQLMTAAVVIFGAVTIVKGSLDVADLLTFLLYIVILIEP